MHHDEKWQLFAPNGKMILGKWRSAELGNPEEDEDDIVGGVAVFLYRRGENGVELLWQKRSELISNGGKWDFSAGGHVNAGESLTEAMVREAHEEIGIDIAEEDLRLVTSGKTYSGMFVWVYLMDWTGRESDFHFDDKEVAEVKWVPYEEMETFREKYAKETLQKKEMTTFRAISNWLKMHGVV